MSERARPVVYYDGACPLCRREIGFYRGCAGAESVDWVDVAATDRPAPDLHKDAALARFHVRATDGRLVSGAAAFLALWAALPRFRGIARILAIPPVAGLLELAYRGFLRIRPLIARQLPP